MSLFSSKKDFLTLFFERNVYKQVNDPLGDFSGGENMPSYLEEEEWEEEDWEEEEEEEW